MIHSEDFETLEHSLTLRMQGVPEQCGTPGEMTIGKKKSFDR